MKYDIKNLTLDEKIQLLTGKNYWQTNDANGKLPSIWLADGPLGLRMANPDGTTKQSTAMPSSVVIANSWNTENARLQGETIADECIQEGADVLLAPGVNMKRTPLCGRNFEYYSEDPILAGYMAKAFIEGVQSKGIGTSLKHFYANNREYDRFVQSSDLDERTAYEIYLPAFEIAVQAQPWTVMCAYNPINGVWASENKQALTDILCGEFGFTGLVMSDWEAVRSGWRAAKAGLDLRMPFNPNEYGEVKTAYEKGWITEEEIDICVQRLLDLIEKTENDKKIITTTKEQRHQNAVKIAEDGIVLLKNEGILPLTEGDLLVCGPFAKAPAFGGGSARAQSDYIPKHLAVELVSASDGKIKADEQCGYFAFRSATSCDFMTDGFTVARKKDAVVLCLGTGFPIEGEHGDRTSIRLTELQEDIILGMAKYNENIVVVLESGSAVDVSPWIDKVKAVVWAGFPGEGGQEAIARVLTGKVCPSGKTSETFPIRLEDTPTGETRGNGFYESYNEGVFMGYRWYDKMQKQVAFPFGFGLSYASFEYSDLKIEKKGELDYEVSYLIKNTSAVDGAEVSQVYVGDIFCRVPRPEKELKGWAKTYLKAGESKRVCIKLNERAFAFYSTALKKWHVESGEFIIQVGASSREIRLSQSIELCLPYDEQYSTLSREIYE